MLQRRNVLLSQRCKFFGHEFGEWMQVRIEPDWKSFRVLIFRKARMSHYRMSLELAPVLLAEMRGELGTLHFFTVSEKSHTYVYLQVHVEM